jgi:hypothetical protein
VEGHQSATDIDFSTVEGAAAIRAALAMVQEVRDDVTGPLARRVALYEKTFGLAVVPVLVRRVSIRLWRRWRLGIRRR